MNITVYSRLKAKCLFLPNIRYSSLSHGKFLFRPIRGLLSATGRSHQSFSVVGPSDETRKSRPPPLSTLQRLHFPRSKTGFLFQLGLWAGPLGLTAQSNLAKNRVKSLEGGGRMSLCACVCVCVCVCVFSAKGVVHFEKAHISDALSLSFACRSLSLSLFCLPVRPFMQHVEQSCYLTYDRAGRP